MKLTKIAVILAVIAGIILYFVLPASQFFLYFGIPAILNLPLGTHEADFKKKQQTEKEGPQKQALSNELKQDLIGNLYYLIGRSLKFL